jgi:beta-phosphoglucomutase-like phosphatase (HAD superfamily)
MSSPLQLITSNDREFLQFMKSRYHLYHASNVFFRDIHYGVMSFLELRKQNKGYTATEAVTREVISHLEHTGILRRIDDRTWMVSHEEFRQMPKTAAPPAKPAAQVPAAQSAS